MLNMQYFSSMTITYRWLVMVGDLYLSLHAVYNLLLLMQRIAVSMLELSKAVLASSQYSASLHALVILLWKLKCEHLP